MALLDDISISVAGAIRETGGATNYPVLDLHESLQSLADDQQASGDDLVDITSSNPSTRLTDQIIQLNAPYNIDDNLSERFFGGSIEQDGGDTLYSGVNILGSVNLGTTQLEVVQDDAILTSFWGDQSGGGYNGDATAGILARFLIKSRVNGADIDGKRIRVQAHEWGDSYAFFNVTLGVGESVAAISTVNDPQNDSVEGTVGAYGDVTNVEGYQTIDIGDGNGAEPYYSQWTYGLQADEMKAIWEYGKYIQRQGTAETIHGVNGGLFLGITHSVPYSGLSGSFTEDERVVWGTDITYDNLTGGTFTEGNYVTIGSSGAAGKVVYDSGTTNMIVALEDTSVVLADNDVITEYNPGTGATGVSADINVTILNNADSGGEGLLLADDSGGTTMHIQLLTGSAPVNTLPLRGISSAATATSGTPTSRTVNPVFLGSYVGTLIGGYGIGIDPDDLVAADRVTNLNDQTRQPPNNVTFTVFGVVVGDRILVTNDNAGAPDFSQLTLNTSLTGGAETAVVTTAAIPVDTPATGTIRVQNDNDINVYQTYTSYTGSTFTIPSSDYSVVNATQPRNVFVTYIDRAATGTSETFTTVFNAQRTLFVRVRDGGASPIVPFETTGTLGSAGGSATAIRNSDA